jgi:short-subunit dehydrogenase
MNVNFYGTLHMTRAFLPHLLSRPEAHIANVSSMGGFVPVPGQTIYGASKAAVKLLTEGLRSELLNTHVKVTVVFPGATATNVAANSGVDVSQLPSANDVPRSIKPLAPSRAAQIIVDGIEHDRYRVLVGSDVAFMDRYYRLSPQRAADTIYRQMQFLFARAGPPPDRSPG